MACLPTLCLHEKQLSWQFTMVRKIKTFFHEGLILIHKLKLENNEGLYWFKIFYFTFHKYTGDPKHLVLTFLEITAFSDSKLELA
jgi:hypothetical protein